jgi:Cu(I)/Ag(I) efflux system membrane protein CusA/SilA
VEKLDAAARLPGWSNAWTAPARARLDMTATGVRTSVAARIVAADPARLERLGTEVRAMALRVPGTRSATFESLGGEPRLEFLPDAGRLASLGVEPALVEATAQLIVTGGQIGELRKDGRPVPVRVAQDLNIRGPADQLRQLTVRGSGAAGAQPVPLALIGRPVYRANPAALRTEGAELAGYVHLDLESDADLAGFVSRARAALAAAQASGDVVLQQGERVEWAGEYPLLVAGARRLAWIVPAVLLSMLGLLYLQFRSLTEALIVLVSVPFALVGSVWTLHWLGYPLSAPVWVGLLSVAGLAMQTGVVMVVYIDDAFFRRLLEGRLRTREDVIEAHAEGTIRRLRPKLMTVTTMAAGLLPLLWAEGAGSEIMRRVAAPMVGGLVTSAFLTLEVIPVLYTVWRVRQLRQAERLGVEPAVVVGPLPRWLGRGA